ncbi:MULTISPECIES: serine/threonine protein kinase [unclassified Streptomyces]|uniref:serine/threonine protein kinase n=1 Tax=unclassified Streptomyces TaxID=2593676 RepID=UPI00131A24AA|nr:MULTISPECIES: serine/threonine protein kinase [unclassified Streptomyces]MYX32251.1 serine/threonine protein kinase [Streptomyces sp. SID8377]
MTEVPIVGTGVINFEFFKIRTGNVDGGRALFEQMVQDLVDVKYPNCSTIEANPGDWGIDAYVGSLIGGEVSVWQSKYFIDEFGESQKKQVRDAYEQALACAVREGYILASWTLCIPVNLDGPTEKWWKGWKGRMEKRDNVTIELWNALRLRRILQSEDARQIREYYFNPTVALPPRVQRHTETLEDYEQYEGALFVRQMREAEMLACEEAKEEFFNAEILSHEITDKGIPDEMKALADTKVVLASLWAQRFNSALQVSSGRKLVGLYERVMDAVREHHPNLPPEIRSNVVHAFGMIHQRVDAGRAGWVRDYRDVAAAYFKEAEDGPLSPTFSEQEDTESTATSVSREGTGGEDVSN